MNSYYAEIRTIDLNLAHISNKHKLTFTFYNNVFRSKTYNLVIQLNDCREKEIIVLSTYGWQKYEYYMKKSCVSNKRNLLELYAELVSIDDDIDKSNIFIVNKLVNFYKKRTITLDEKEKYKLTLPYNWLFKWEEEMIKEVTLATYLITWENIMSIEGKKLINDICLLTLKKNLILSAIDWSIINEKVNAPFIIDYSFEMQKIENKDKKGWILYNGLYSKRLDTSDEIVFNEPNSSKGLVFPFYTPFSPITFEFVWKASFLYWIEFKFFLSIQKENLLITNNCKIKALYCLQINPFVNTTIFNENVKELFFTNLDLEEFLYNGFNLNWFKNWSKKRDYKKI